VIGAGIGGLICANLLAKDGMKVLLLERHYMLAVFVPPFAARFIFDAATHFYPLLGNPTTLTGKVLVELGCETEWIRMDPVGISPLCRYPVFTVPDQFATYVDGCKRWFPAEAANIRMPTSRSCGRPTCMSAVLLPRRCNEPFAGSWNLFRWREDRPVFPGSALKII